MRARVTVRNARFQQWQALLENRAKRQRRGEFLVQGVRPISMAATHGWPIRELLYDDTARLSAWAREMLDTTPGAERIAVSGDLMGELGGKSDTAPELLAVVGLPDDDLRRIPAGPGMLTVVFDRPASPGNIGTLVRSADAFGASGVVVTGHAADVYDPRAVRASTGSLFALPVVRVPTHREVLSWAGPGTCVVGADEHGDLDVAAYDFTQSTVAVIGNETTGLSAAWRAACDRLLRIPIAGSASSLNAAEAATVLLYEASRRR